MLCDKKIIGYVYKTTRISTGEFYIGRHLWKSNIIDRNYYGSGIWVKNFKKKNKRKWMNDLKCEAIEYYYDIESLYEGELHHIRENYNDHLNKNMSTGLVGSCNHRYKDEKFYWINIHNGECLHITRLGLFEIIKCKRSQITGCIYGKYHSVNGWYFMGKEKLFIDIDFIRNKINKIGEFAYNFDSKNYKWINPYTNEIVFKNQLEMANFIHCNKSMVNQVIHGNKLSVKGWYLFEKYDENSVNKSEQRGKFSSSYVKDTYDWEYPNGEIVYNKTPYEVFTDLGLKSRSHVNRVVKGEFKQYKGLKLYKGIYYGNT